MQAPKMSSPAAYYYLTAVPFLTAIIGFGIGRSSAWVYVPVWLAHTILMLVLLRRLAGGNIKNNSGRPFFVSGIMLVIPWVMFSIFAGFGPPPSTIAQWVALAIEEQLRYMILVAGGICATIGLTLLKQAIGHSPGKTYVSAATVIVNISMPLYVINMLFWGFFLTEAFKGFAGQGTTRPDWYVVIKQLFFWIASVQLCLFYIAIALFAAGLKKSNTFKPVACNIYVIVSLLAAVCSLLPGNVPMPLTVIGYFVAIPAIGFIMPYLIGLNLMRYYSKTLL